MKQDREEHTRTGWQAWLLLGCLLPATLTAGCRRRSASSVVSVRLINAVADAGALTVAVDGQRVWRRSPYRNNTGFRGVPEGDYDVRVSVVGASAPLAALPPLAFRRDRVYTIVALGAVGMGGAPPGVRVFEDARDERLSDGKTRVRLINAAPGAVDVLINNIVGLKRVGYGQRSDALLLDGAAYDLKINASGSSVAPLIGPVSLRLDAGRSYTLVVMGSRAAGSLTLEAYPDGE